MRAVRRAPGVGVFLLSGATRRSFVSSRSCFCAERAQSPYDVLRLKPPVTLSQVKTAYYSLALKYHPDVNSSPEAQDEFRKIGEAYAVVKEDVVREEARVEPYLETMLKSLDNHWLKRLYYFFVEERDEDRIESLLRQRKFAEALEIYTQKKQRGEKPSQALYGMMLRGCSMMMRWPKPGHEPDHVTATLLAQAQEIFQDLNDHYNFEPSDYNVYEMMKCYGKAGGFDEAWRLFTHAVNERELRPAKYVINWMLEISVNNGRYEHLSDILLIMEQQRSMLKGTWRPDPVTMGLALKASVDSGDVTLLPSLVRQFGGYGLKPTSDAADVLLSAAVQAGRVDVALELRTELRAQRVAVKEDTMLALGKAEERLMLGGRRGEEAKDAPPSLSALGGATDASLVNSDKSSEPRSRG